MSNDPNVVRARELLEKISQALEWTLNEVLIEFVPSDSFIGQIVYQMAEIEKFKSKPFSDFLYHLTDAEVSEKMDIDSFLGSGCGDMDPVNIFAVLIPIYESLD